MPASNYIEPGIKPVCDALNAISGVTTVYSCEGHFWRSETPFVIFDATIETAFKIHRLLGYANGVSRGDGNGYLDINWLMEARFQDDGSLRYFLGTFDKRMANGSWRLWMKKNDELNRLASLLARAG